MRTTLISAIFLLPIANGDFTSYHLHNLLNYSVSPCSDFHSHVCSAIVNRTQTIHYKTLRFYVDWAIRLDARSDSNVIMNFITASLKLNDSCEFNVSQYEWSLRKRCGSIFDCYTDEFKYFDNFHQKITNQVFATKIFTNIKHNVTRIVEVTSRAVVKILQRFEIVNNFYGVVVSYLTLLDRLAIMIDLERTNTSDLFGLAKIQNLVHSIKISLANRFKETQWLRESNSLTRFLKILDEMSIGIDFDEQDRNLETWRRINRTFTSRFFEYSKRSTGCSKFDTYHPLDNALDKILKSNENWKTLSRIEYGPKYNAIYHRVFNEVVLFATTFYPLLQGNSSTTTVFASAVTFAHEILHPFAHRNITNISETAKKEYDCLTAHYEKSCIIWAKNRCNSGVLTFDEDSPDVEAMRTVYDMFRTNYTEEQLKEWEYEDLGITREQAFFYAYGVHYCNRVHAPEWGRHSNLSIRLNSVVSMMPEFTTAFGCRPDNKEYADEESVCHIFGPRAGVGRTPKEEGENVDGSGHEVEVDSTPNDLNTSTTVETRDTVDEELSGSGEVPNGLEMNDDLLS